MHNNLSKLIKKVINYIRRYYYLQEFAKINRQRQIVNLSDAKSIGLLYNVLDEETYHIADAFAKKLKQDNKYVHVLGFIDLKYTQPFIIPTLATDFFIKKDINWYGKPNNQFVKDFIERDFDILINLSLNDNYTLQYISGLSKAKFKVGTSNKNNSEFYDFLFELPIHTKLSEYIKQIEYYLTLINKKI